MSIILLNLSSPFPLIIPSTPSCIRDNDCAALGGFEGFSLDVSVTRTSPAALMDSTNEGIVA